MTPYGDHGRKTSQLKQEHRVRVHSQEPTKQMEGSPQPRGWQGRQRSHRWQQRSTTCKAMKQRRSKWRGSCHDPPTPGPAQVGQGLQTPGQVVQGFVREQSGPRIHPGFTEDQVGFTGLLTQANRARAKGRQVGS